MDWSKLPDLAAVALLAAAFAAVARRGHAASVSVLWLTGWALIALHFAAFLFAPAAGSLGVVAVFVGVGALVWAGLLFTWASVPYRRTPSSVAMLVTLMGANLLYVGIILIYPSHPWALNTAAALLGVLPLAVALAALPANNHPMRWIVVGLYGALSVFLLVFQNRSGDGLTLPLNALMFSVYFGCSLHFLHAYRRKTMGEFITIAGFVSWSSVFVLGPSLGVLLPAIQLENEVWNLPKYVVAVGMILMLLEEQIADNKYLALHDELTGLPNRRLFQDRLANALERARRSGSQAALLLIDLDQFKEVNDTLGHHAGDQLLKHVGKVFSERVRRSDTVARTGGDEFSVILDHPTSLEDAELVGHSLIDLLTQPLQIGDRTVRVGASVGIAIYPDDALDAEGLCIAADQRMYRFKYRNGRNADLARPPQSIGIADIEPETQRQAG